MRKVIGNVKRSCSIRDYRCHRGRSWSEGVRMKAMNRRNQSTENAPSRIHERIMRDPAARESYRAQRELVELGRSLRQARTQLRATQAQAEKKAGMSQAKMRRLENGLLQNGVMYSTIVQLCRVLGRQVVLSRRTQNTR